MYPDDDPKPLANSSARGAACAVGAVMVQAFAAVLGLGVASRFVIIPVSPAIPVLGISSSLIARHARGPPIAGQVARLASRVLSWTISASALLRALP